MGSSGSGGPTKQQQQLETEQALTSANLNLEENEQRKSILNALQGTRVFRGSALSRAVAGNTNAAPASNPAPGPSRTQQTNGVVNDIPQSVVSTSKSLLDGAGSTPSGGNGESGAQIIARGGSSGVRV